VNVIKQKRPQTKILFSRLIEGTKQSLLIPSIIDLSICSNDNDFLEHILKQNGECMTEDNIGLWIVGATRNNNQKASEMLMEFANQMKIGSNEKFKERIRLASRGKRTYELILKVRCFETIDYSSLERDLPSIKRKRENNEDIPKWSRKKCRT
jgi:hypothetical protein